jgi:hypothetical protein
LSQTKIDDLYRSYNEELENHLRKYMSIFDIAIQTIPIYDYNGNDLDKNLEIFYIFCIKEGTNEHKIGITTTGLDKRTQSYKTGR